jgi:hypothetical protein
VGDSVETGSDGKRGARSLVEIVLDTKGFSMAAPSVGE